MNHTYRRRLIAAFSTVLMAGLGASSASSAAGASVGPEGGALGRAGLESGLAGGGAVGAPGGPDGPARGRSEALGAPAASNGRFMWPLDPAPEVVRGFDAPEDPFGQGHRGVDLAGSPGQPALAAGSGTVVFAGRLAGRGVVSIEHDGGLRTTYEPLVPTVVVGARVHQGQQVGTLVAGHPECAATACLHWGVRKGRDYLDPLTLLVETRLRLKPWTG